MSPELSLVIRALRKHRTMCVLIAVQIAIACAVLSNGLNLVHHRYTLEHLSTGLSDGRLIVVDVEPLRGQLDNVQRLEAMSAISSLPGVDSVAYVNALPFSQRGSTYAFSSRADLSSRLDASVYYGSPGYLQTLGVRILVGRGFQQSDFSEPVTDPIARSSIIILTQSLARRLSATVGTRVYIEGRGLTVIGISADVQQPSVVDPNDAGNSAFVATPPGVALGSQIVINTGAALPARIGDVTAAATRATPASLVWSAKRFEDIRADYFQFDHAVVRLILVLGGLLALVVAAGIGGLSSYWIARRHKQIAIRRSLGARKSDIAWYFRIENLLTTAMGVAAGLILALATSIALTRFVGVPAMPAGPLALSAVAMLIIGQLAIMAPVRRAIAIEPAALKAA